MKSNHDRYTNRKESWNNKTCCTCASVSSRLTANNNVGCAGMTKLTLSVWTIAMKYIGGIPILMTIGTIMEAVAVCEITIIATMATKTMTSQGID